MTWQELQIFFKGKVFLIGLTFIDEDGNVVEQYQTSGTVDELTDNGFFNFNRSNSGIFQLPYDERAIKEAAKGEYRERSTGNIIVNPDYITTWVIDVKSKDNLDDIKQNGFTPEHWIFEN
jgi:hypothetical protein